MQNYFIKPLLFFGVFSLSFTQGEKKKDFFPIWGTEAVQRGYVLPKPMGLNFIYVDMDQTVDITSLKLKGDVSTKPSSITIGNRPISIPSKPLGSLDSIISIKAKPAKSSNKNKILRADLWVFPFLNLYGIIGDTKGYSKTKIDVYAPMLSETPLLTNADFKLDYDGITYGGGMVLAGGYGNFFTLVDTNYTMTSLNVIEGQISALVVSPKIGYRFDIKNTSNSVWVGAMYQEITQTLKGDINDIMDMANIPLIQVENGKFEVKEKSASPWNPVIGFRTEINRTYEIVVEAGLGTRKSITASLGYRF